MVMLQNVWPHRLHSKEDLPLVWKFIIFIMTWHDERLSGGTAPTSSGSWKPDRQICCHTQPPTHFVIFIIVNIIVFIDIMSLHILFKILAFNLKLSKAPHVCPQDTYLLHCFQKGSYFREHGSIGAFLTLWVPIGSLLYFKVPISRFWVNFNFINWRYRSLLDPYFIKSWVSIGSLFISRSL